MPKHSIHLVHKCRRSISQPKRHYPKLIMTIPDSKGHIFNIISSHPQLVITRMKINLREITIPLNLVKQVISSPKRIHILDGFFIKLTMINAHSKRPILIFKNNTEAHNREILDRMKPFFRKSIRYSLNSSRLIE